MKDLLKKNPKISLKYDVSTAVFSKSEDADPVFATSEKGNFSIDLRRGLLIAGLFAAFSFFVKLRRLCRRCGKK